MRNKFLFGFVAGLVALCLIAAVPGTGPVLLWNPFLQTVLNGNDSIHGNQGLTNISFVSAQSVSASTSMTLGGSTITAWPTNSGGGTNFSLVNGVAGAVT